MSAVTVPSGPGSAFFTTLDAGAMLDCEQFLAGYSDFRDGRLDPAHSETFENHRASCSSCERYDRVIRRGAELFRAFPRLQPSEDFRPRLQHRIFHVEDEMRSAGRRASGASVAMTMAIAVLIALSAWAPVVNSSPEPQRLPSVAAAPPVNDGPASLFRSGPLLGPAETVSGNAADHALFFRYAPLGADGMYSARLVSE